MGKDLHETFSDEKFLADLKKCSTTEDVAKLFSEHGLKVNAEILHDAIMAINAVKSGVISTPVTAEKIEDDELPDELAEKVAGGGSVSSELSGQFSKIFSVMGDNPMVISIIMENLAGERAAVAAANLRAVAYIIEKHYGIPLAAQTMNMATQVFQMINSGELNV